MPKTESKQQLGVRGEDLACAELERQGMQVLERNWRCRLGEIDIVAAEAGEDGLTLAFVRWGVRSGLGFWPRWGDPRARRCGRWGAGGLVDREHHIKERLQGRDRRPAHWSGIGAAQGGDWSNRRAAR